MTSASSLVFTDEQLRERKNSIGASECGSVLGVVGAYKTPYQVWLDKTSPDVLASIQTVYTRRGTILEPYVMKAAELKWGEEIWGNRVKTSHLDKKFLTCTPDGYYDESEKEKDPRIAIPILKRRLVQIKTSTENQEGNYGLEGTSDVPLNYLFQCYHEMLVTGAKSVDLIVYFATEPEFDASIYMTENMDPEQVGLYISNSKLKKYHIERNEGRLQRLEKLLTDFWKCVVDKTAPKNNPAIEDFIFDTPAPEIKQVKDLSTEERMVALNYLNAKEALDSRKKVFEEARTEIRESLGEGIVWSIDGNNLQYKRNRPGMKTDWETIAKDAFVDKQAIRKCKEIVSAADLSERERLAILKGLEANDLHPKLVDRFIKSAKSKARPITKGTQEAFLALSENCRIPPEIVMEYTHHYPGAKVLRNKKEKEYNEDNN